MSTLEGAATRLDFDDHPFIVIWVHCRACAQPLRSAPELSTSEAERLMAEIAEMHVPVFVLTGGDPLKRPDVYHLVEYGIRLGVRVSLTPSATPLLTRSAIERLQRSGLARLAVSLDGSTVVAPEACFASLRYLHLPQTPKRVPYAKEGDRQKTKKKLDMRKETR